MKTTIVLNSQELADVLLPFVVEHLGYPLLASGDLELSVISGDFGFQEMTIAVTFSDEVSSERVQLAQKRQKSSEYYQKNRKELLCKRKERYENQKLQTNPNTPKEKPE